MGTNPLFSPEKEARHLLALLRNVEVKEGQFEKVTESLTRAVSEGLPICVDGEGRSFDVALSLKSILLGLGASAYRAREPPLFRPGSVYIAVSGSGATTGPMKRMELARDAGMETILITEKKAHQHGSRMAQLADLVIELPGPSGPEAGGKDWLEKELAGATSVAPMGTLFEEAAFLSCLVISTNVISQLGNVSLPELADLGKGGFREQYVRLLEVSGNGGRVSETKVTGLLAEAGGAAHVVERLYMSKREMADGLRARMKGTDERMMGELAREIGPEVILAGEGVANYTLEMFAQRLYHLSFRAHTISGTIVPPITKEKLVLMLSCSGESSSPVTAAKIAAMKGAWFSPITAFWDSSLAEVAKGAGRQITRLSGLGYIRNVGFEERRLGKKLSVPDPVFCAKALLLLDAMTAKEIALLELKEGDLKKRHQQDKAEYL